MLHSLGSVVLSARCKGVVSVVRARDCSDGRRHRRGISTARSNPVPPVAAAAAGPVVYPLPATNIRSTALDTGAHRHRRIPHPLPCGLAVPLRNPAPSTDMAMPTLCVSSALAVPLRRPSEGQRLPRSTMRPARGLAVAVHAGRGDVTQMVPSTLPPQPPPNGLFGGQGATVAIIALQVNPSATSHPAPRNQPLGRHLHPDVKATCLTLAVTRCRQWVWWAPL